MAKDELPQAEATFCSTRDAAELLGISIKTAQAWVETGVLEAWKTPGGHRRISRRSVDALLATRMPQTRTPALRTNGSAARCTIIAVDDDPTMRQLYEMNIGFWQLPLQLITAANGIEGLLRIGEVAPQILITDLKMPDMDGFQMLRTLRATAQYGAMRIMVVSALDATEIKAHGGLPEHVEFFAKPLQFDRLKRSVETAIQAFAPGVRV